MGTDNSNEDLILLGDFNLPNINWDTMSGSIPWSTYFCDFLFKLNLEQFITTSTHIAGNILDVILTNTTIISEIQVITPLPWGLSSDHHLIYFILSVDQPPVPHKFHQSVYDYSKANWDGFLHYLQSQDYTDYLNTSNVKTLWSSLKHLIYQALSMFVPIITIKAHHCPKWFTFALQHQLNRLHAMRKRYSSSSSPSNLARFQTAEQNCQLATSAAKHDYKLINFPQKETALSTNIFPFSQTTVVFQPQCTIIVPLPVLTMTSTSFQWILFSVFTRDSSSTPLSALDSSHGINIFENIAISPSDVYNALTALDPNKAQGIDRIGPKVWKKVLQSYTTLFTSFLLTV